MTEIKVRWIAGEFAYIGKVSVGRAWPRGNYYHAITQSYICGICNDTRSFTTYDEARNFVETETIAALTGINLIKDHTDDT